MITSTRVHNFCAGPCTLPVPVLEEVRDEFLDFDGTGMSIIEASHRAAAYDAVHMEALADFRSLAAIPKPTCPTRIIFFVVAIISELIFP